MSNFDCDLQGLQSMCILVLAHNQLTEFDFDALGHLPLIDIVDVSFNRIQGLFPTLAGNYSVLNLAHNELKGPGPVPCRLHICNFPGGFMQWPARLSYLDVSFNLITEFQGRVFTAREKPFCGDFVASYELSLAANRLG